VLLLQLNSDVITLFFFHMNTSVRQYQVRSRVIETYHMYTLLPCTTQVSSYIVAMELLYTLQYHCHKAVLLPNSCNQKWSCYQPQMLVFEFSIELCSSRPSPPLSALSLLQTVNIMSTFIR